MERKRLLLEKKITDGHLHLTYEGLTPLMVNLYIVLKQKHIVIIDLSYL